MRIALALGLALPLAWTSAAGAPADRKDVVLRGLVSDDQGRPLSGAQVTATGPQSVMTVSNVAGRFTITLRPGTLATLERAPSRFVVEARHRGHRIPLLGGRDRLEIELKAAPAGGEESRVSVKANDPSLASMLERQLAVPGSVTAWGEVEFSRRKAPPAEKGDSAPNAGPVANRERDAASTVTKPAVTPVRDSDSRPAPTSAAPVTPAVAAPLTPATPAPVTPTTATPVPPPTAAPVPPAAATPVPPTAPPQATGAETPRTNSAEPPRARASDPPPPAPENRRPAAARPALAKTPHGTHSTAAPAPAPAAPLLAPSRRVGDRDGLTALELLEEIKRHGSVTAAEDYADSVRASERDRERRHLAQVREAEVIERSLRREEERARRLAAERARDSVQAERRREAAAAIERERRARETASRAPAPVTREAPRGLPPAPARGATDARDRSATDARAQSDAGRREETGREGKRRAREQRKIESRLRADSLRAARALADERRKAEQRAESARIESRRDSVFRVLQMRESLKRAALVRDSIRAVARRESLLAVRPAPAPLRSGPVVGGRALAPEVAADSCSCRIRGTVEIRMDGRLDTPVRVVVGVYGGRQASAAVRLFMGPPRSFALPPVPCGRVSLELTITSRLRFVPLNPRALTDLPCRPGQVLQPRIVLVPAAPR